MSESDRQRVVTGCGEWVVFWGIVVGALVVRLMGIGRHPVWLDEACSVLMAHSPRGVWTELRQDTNAPLYFVLLKGWIGIFGIGAAGIRSLSAVCGAGAVAVLGMWMRESGASQRSVRWGMVLGAIAPMQVFYSQEARPYALAWLLVAAALWTFVRAMRRGDWREWGMHGVAVVAGCYTHNLFVPLAGGFWMAAVLMRARREQWVRMVVTYGVVAAAYVPGAMLLLGQMKGSGGTEWIASYWRETGAWEVIPRSLEALTIGGETLLWPILPAVWRWVCIGIVMVVGAAAFWRKGGWKECGAFRWVVVVFALWPLVDLWLYSVLQKPIYMIGRYDLFAEPACLAVLGLGLGRLTGGMKGKGWRVEKWGKVGGWACAAGVVGVMVAASWQRNTMPLLKADEAKVARAEFLRESVMPGDVVVCMALEGAVTEYDCARDHLQCEVRTLPLETLSHPGWMEAPHLQEARMKGIEGEVEALWGEIERLHPRHVWMVNAAEGRYPWEGPGRYVCDEITRRFCEGAVARGWELRGQGLRWTGLTRVAGLERGAVAAGR